jgi:hypothetical protein
MIMQNFVGTLVVDSMVVGMAAFGFLNPAPGRLYSRDLRVGIHPQFHEIVAWWCRIRAMIGGVGAKSEFWV